MSDDNVVNINTIIEKQVVKETESSFSQAVENRVWEKDISYMEAIVEVMMEKKIEAPQVSKLLSKEIKNILQCEATDLSLLKK